MMFSKSQLGQVMCSSLVAMALIGMVTGATQAASYENLAAQGYKTGPWTKSRGGVLGWKVTNGTKSFFCKSRVSLAYVGKTGLVTITSSGRHIGMDRQMFEEYTGKSDRWIPQLSDLKAGRLKPDDVGACTPS